jgi:O-antigen ligase
MTAAACVRSALTLGDQAPVVVGFGRRPWSIPVRPVVALRWALLALVIANLGRVPVLSSAGRDTSVVINDLCVTMLVVLGALAATLRRSLMIDRVALAALTFAFVGFASAVYAVPRFGLTPLQLFVSLSYLARWLTYFGIYLFVINNVRPTRVDSVWGSLEAVVMAIAIFGIFQSIFLPGFTQMVYSGPDNVGWDKQGHRLVSTVLEPNIAASMIVLVLLVQLARIAVGASVAWWKPTVLLVALALTISRSGILALLVGIMVILAARGLSVRLLRFFGLLAVLTVAVLPRLIAFAAAYGKFSLGETSSAGVRLYAWALALGTVADHPLIGVGFNTFGYYKQNTGMLVRTSADYSSDGGLLFVAVMTGLIGLAIYCGMLALVMRRCRTIWRDMTQTASHRGFAIGVAAGVASLVVHSLFVNSIFTTFVMEIMWVSWGLTFVMTLRDADAPTMAPLSGARA